MSRSTMRSCPTMMRLTSNRVRSSRADASATVVESVGSAGNCAPRAACDASRSDSEGRSPGGVPVDRSGAVQKCTSPAPERIPRGGRPLSERSAGICHRREAHHHRRPTAGRVLDGELAVHRLHETARHREPETHAGAVRAGPRDAGTARTPARAGRAGCPCPGRRRGARRGRARCRRRCGRVDRGGSRGARSSTRFATARSSKPASPFTRGSVSGTSTTTSATRAASSPERIVYSAAGTISSKPTSRNTSSTAPVCSRLMSSRLPTRSLSRSDSSSMVSRNSRSVYSSPLDVLLQQARGRRLDRRERRAQIVGHRGEQGGPELVGLCEAFRGGGLRTQSSPLDDERELAGECTQQSSMSSFVDAGDGQHGVFVERHADVGVFRSTRDGFARAALDDPSAPVLRRTAGRDAPERRSQSGHEPGQAGPVR